MSKTICGIDEAGRGPVLGPLVLCGVAMDEKDLPILAKIGARDSKLLKPARREEIATEIRKVAEKIEVIKIYPQEIDGRSAVGLNLNDLEALKCAEILTAIKPDVAYIDSPVSPDGDHFRHSIKRFADLELEMHCEHKADRNHKIVGAASIIAKVARDAEIEKIKECTGIEIGSGYPADEITKKALREHFGKLAPYVRKSWATAKRFEEKEKQATLDGF